MCKSVFNEIPSKILVVHLMKLHTHSIFIYIFFSYWTYSLCKLHNMQVLAKVNELHTIYASKFHEKREQIVCYYEILVLHSLNTSEIDLNSTWSNGRENEEKAKEFRSRHCCRCNQSLSRVNEEIPSYGSSKFIASYTHTHSHAIQCWLFLLLFSF